MELTFLDRREATLANGDCLSLGAAVQHFMSLRIQLALQEEEWDVVYHLREVCLGRPIEPEVERYLIRDGWLREDGTVDPAMKSVVLASVRGEERLLHLDSPFTDSVDRALADFFLSREELLAKLDPTDTHVVFKKPLFQKSLDALAEEDGTVSPSPEEWPEGVPPPTEDEIKSFVRRLNERMDGPNKPDFPPPPN